MRPLLCALLAASLLVQACASQLPPRAHFEEDQYGRYYETTNGTIIRIEQDGTMVDVTCTEPELAKGMARQDLVRLLCPSGKVAVVGKAKPLGAPSSPTTGEKLRRPTGTPAPTGQDRTVAPTGPTAEWDTSPYEIAPETGTCAPLFAPFSDTWAAEKRRSCAHRFWEVPVAVVVYPTLGALILGVVTSPVWLPLLIFAKK
ncbi:MAG: hypothetical protein U0172_06255 [Nitrospiraceae bacterium]